MRVAGRAAGGAILLLILGLLTFGCTTTERIPRPGGRVEYLIACEASTGWKCYAHANEVCPAGYTTVSEGAGFNRKELRISCGQGARGAARRATTGG